MTATVRTCSSGLRATSWIESTAPSEETQSRGSSRSRSALRAYSIEEIGARSSSPREQPRVQLGRHALHLLDLGVEPVEDRRHVHVGDAAEPDHSRLPVDDGVGEGLELLAAERAVEAGARAARVVERDLARALERAGLGDADERAVERPAGERAPDDRVLARGEEQRQRRRALAQVGAGDLAGLDRLARAVEDVVGDLEGDPEREPELAEAPSPPLPSRQAASNSFPVFSAQRSR